MAEDHAYQSLRENQTQLDDHGEMVAVSRQALDEVLDQLDEARKALKFYAEGEWADGYPGGVYLEDGSNAIIDTGHKARDFFKWNHTR